MLFFILSIFIFYQPLKQQKDSYFSYDLKCLKNSLLLELLVKSLNRQINDGVVITELIGPSDRTFDLTFDLLNQ